MTNPTLSAGNKAHAWSEACNNILVVPTLPDLGTPEWSQEITRWHPEAIQVEGISLPSILKLPY